MVTFNGYSAFMTMKSYYPQNDILSHNEFESFFEKASQFSREFTSSKGTNHSMHGRLDITMN